MFCNKILFQITHSIQCVSCSFFGIVGEIKQQFLSKTQPFSHCMMMDAFVRRIAFKIDGCVWGKCCECTGNGFDLCPDLPINISAPFPS